MDTVRHPTSEFNTSDHPHAFDMWRDRMASTYDVSLADPEDPVFRVVFRGWSLGSVAVIGGSYTAQVFRRDLNMVRRDQLDQFGFFAQGEGQRVSTAGGRERVIRPGNVQFFDMAQAEVSFAQPGTSGSLLLPREVVEQVLPDAARYHGLVLNDGMAKILASHILQIGEHFPNVPAGAPASIASASVDLALGSLTGALGEAGELPNLAFQVAARRRIERYINDRLGDPALCAGQIQAEFGLSRSALYRLFESSHGVGRYIKYRRLVRIRTILVENHDTRTLSALAADFGFQSGAHFSREFQREFGCTPSEVRAGTSVNVWPEGQAGSIAALYRSVQA